MISTHEVFWTDVAENDLKKIIMHHNLYKTYTAFSLCLLPIAHRQSPMAHRLSKHCAPNPNESFRRSYLLD